MVKIRTAFSPSFLKTYIEGCPFCAVNNPFTKSDATMFGTFMHEMAEYHVDTNSDENGIYTGVLLNVEESLEKLRQFVLKNNLNYTKFMDKGRNAINNWNIYRSYLNPGFIVWDTESSKAPADCKESFYGKTFLSVPVFSKGRRLRGAMDRVDAWKEKSIWVISDYKTGKSTYSKFQLLLYTIMFRLAYNIAEDVVRCRYIFLESGEFFSFQPTPQEIQNVYEQCVRAVDTYDTGIHMKKGSYKNCMFCKVPDCKERRGR